VQHGNVELWVHSNNVIKFYTFTMTGRLEPDVPALREQFVAATMARLWG
jgi:hypothetical protein